MDRDQPDLNPPPDRPEPWRWLVLAALAVAAALRVVLVRQGGQMFWSDETRFDVARDAADQLARHDFAGAARALLGGADHLLFKLVGVLPAGLDRLLHGTGYEIPAYCFAGCSVLNIFLVWRIARAAGAGAREAAVAALLLAVAATNFYYARHLFPYDLSLTFGLLALWVGWSGGGWRRSLGCGVLAGLAFLTYAGAWLFGAVVLAGHVLQAPDVKRATVRALQAGAGLALPIGAAIGLARLVGVDLVASFLHFSQTINQGDFGRGWKLLLEYFWSAEGPNLGLGLAGLLLAAAGAVAARQWNRGAWWCVGAAGVLLGLLLLSDVWPKFVIYGRTARFVVPFVCLAAAGALERLWRMGGRAGGVATVVAAFALAQGAANLGPPLQQVFPRQFHREAARVKEEARRRGDARQLAVIYAAMLVGRASILETPLPDHDVLLAAPNPLQYRPYLAEGFDEPTRTLLRETDVRMRLIAVNHARFDHPSDLRRPYPGVVQLTLQLPDVRPAGVPEPLLVTGETGRGDFLYLVYQPDASIRIGFDHWLHPGKLSDPIPVDPAKPVVINLSMGPLHDPRSEPAEANAVDAREWLYVEVNGRVLWSHPAQFHAAPPDSIAYLNNYIGGSTAGGKFTGTVLRIRSLLVPPFSDRREEIR